MTHPSPPYDSSTERWNDWPRQQKRKLRKLFGWPASYDVGVIGAFVRALKEETERVVGFNITSAAASVPAFPALYDEDLYDAFEYAGLEYIQLIQFSPHKQLLTWEPKAAVAGHGFGLCPNIEHPQECWKVWEGFWDDVYYIVVYTRTSLAAYHYYTFYDGVYSGVVHPRFYLGFGNDPTCEPIRSPRGHRDWEQARLMMLQQLQVNDGKKPTKIILVGESANDPEFRSQLDEVFEEFFTDGVPPIFDRDPEYIQAKGVAELVRRSAYLQKPQRPEGVEGVMDLTGATGSHQDEEGQTNAQKVILDLV